mgnify:FL=1
MGLAVFGMTAGGRHMLAMRVGAHLMDGNTLTAAHAVRAGAVECVRRLLGRGERLDEAVDDGLGVVAVHGDSTVSPCLMPRPMMDRMEPAGTGLPPCLAMVTLQPDAVAA